MFDFYKTGTDRTVSLRSFDWCRCYQKWFGISCLNTTFTLKSKNDLIWFEIILFAKWFDLIWFENFEFQKWFDLIWKNCIQKMIWFDLKGRCDLIWFALKKMIWYHTWKLAIYIRFFINRKRWISAFQWFLNGFFA